jgi:RecJ-like exonuclease
MENKFPCRECKGSGWQCPSDKPYGHNNCSLAKTIHCENDCKVGIPCPTCGSGFMAVGVECEDCHGTSEKAFYGGGCHRWEMGLCDKCQDGYRPLSELELEDLLNDVIPDGPRCGRINA